MSRIGVGLVAYNMSEYDIKALSNTFRKGSFAYKVVVDNSKTDVSQKIFEENNWIYIHHPENLGFGKAHNQIFEKYNEKADYHLIVNPDVSFEIEIVEELQKFLEKNLSAGCVMPKVLYPTGEIQRLAKLLPSPIDLMIRRLPINNLKRRFNMKLELHKANYNTGIFKAPFISGCFILFRVQSIRKIGFFDERYFMYLEDTDLSRRLWLIEEYPYYYGLNSIKHGYAKGSSKNVKLFLIHINSAIKYFFKWGWFDSERKIINRQCLNQFNSDG